MRRHDARFWLWHAVVPLAAFTVTIVLLAATSFDVSVARAWAWDATAAQWVGHGRWWADVMLHRGGRDLVLGVIGVLLSVAAVGSLRDGWRDRRGGALYALVSIMLAWGLVGGLKQLTNVDCPWALQGFGGSHPYVRLLIDRPDQLGRAACYPGAHSASGFSLFAFYFVFRERRPRRARTALCAAAAIGVAFAFAQEARGAHFLSHDLTSAFLAWFVCLGTYAAWPIGGAGGRIRRMR